MTRNYYTPGKVNPHLPHDGVEIEPRSKDTATAARDADLLVSQLMQGNTEPPQDQAHDQVQAENAAPSRRMSKPLPGAGSDGLPNTAPEIAKTATDAPGQSAMNSAAQSGGQGEAESETQLRVPTRPVSVIAPIAKVTGPAPKPASSQTVAEPSAPQPAETKPLEDSPAATARDDVSLKGQMREAFPPLPAQEKPSLLQRVPPVYPVALASGLVVLIWPTLLFWLLVSIGLFLIAFAALMKLPGAANLFGALWGKFVRRNPTRAERVRKIADRLAMMIERGLDLLPGSLADRLSLPDFSQPVASKR